MKLKLMAVAVAGALSVPGLAVAQATNVQLYGGLDVAVDSTKYTSNNAGTISGLRKEHLTHNAPSFIGVRGTESLGGGLTAFFQVEGEIPLSTGRPLAASDYSGRFFMGGRTTFVGLRAGWGEVSAGFQPSAYMDVNRVWNAMPTRGHGTMIMNNQIGSGSIPSPNCGGALSNGTGLITAVATPACLTGVEHGAATFGNAGLNNSLKYVTPVIAGFRFNTVMAFSEHEEASTSTPAGTARYEGGFGSYALTWRGGPFSAGAGYAVHRGWRATNAVGSDRNAKDTGWQIGGKWNFGAGELGLGWERLKYGNSGTAAAPNNFDIKNWVINGNFKIMPNGTISAGYSHTPGANNCGAGLGTAAVTPVTGAAACGGAGKATALSLAYDHALSKRTGLYAAYGRINNGSGSSYYYNSAQQTGSAGGAVFSLSPGTDVTTYMAGVKHRF